ncbi:DUF7331 family protein [Halegenticoccus soli]|uniref:DUF7331 family protein n=1 Tax=Halegenticoccus soli TaxID=1985678 RepID=UPI0018EC5C51|nr:hypothetical protein [Halegenticoccus soli]
MSDRAIDEERGIDASDEPPKVPDGVETIESYETDGGVVFYDADNPLAWMQAARTVPLKECA